MLMGRRIIDPQGKIVAEGLNRYLLLGNANDEQDIEPRAWIYTSKTLCLQDV